MSSIKDVPFQDFSTSFSGSAFGREVAGIMVLRLVRGGRGGERGGMKECWEFRRSFLVKLSAPAAVLPGLLLED